MSRWWMVTGAMMLTADSPIYAAIPLRPRIDGPAVVLVWASWCAPCRAEIARMASLKRAAAPLPVVTLAIDEGKAADHALARADARPDRALVDDRPPAVALAAWGATMLPFAVALDRAGRICARRQGLLGTDQVRDWARRCSR